MSNSSSIGSTNIHVRRSDKDRGEAIEQEKRRQAHNPIETLLSQNSSQSEEAADKLSTYLISTDSYQSLPKEEFLSRLRSDFITSVSKHAISEHTLLEGGEKQFITSVQSMQKEVSAALDAIVAEPESSLAFASLDKLLPKSQDLLMQASMSLASVTSTAAQSQATGGLISSLILDGGYNPRRSVDVDLMNAVFSAIDIGTAISNATNATADIYTSISSMMNDLSALANFFNQLYSTLKAELNQRQKSGQQAPPTLNWDTDAKASNKTFPVKNAAGHDTDWNFATLIYNAGQDLNSKFVAQTDDNSDELKHATELYGVSSVDLPFPNNQNLRALFLTFAGVQIVNPEIMSKIVGAVSNAMQGLIQSDLSVNSGSGQFAQNWQNFASNDGQTTGAIQAFSSTMSTLSQKASQTTSTVNLVLNTIQTLFQKLLDLISSSGASRDKLSNV